MSVSAIPSAATRAMSCTSCHGSSDPNGPKGPHSSSYRHILSLGYVTRDGAPESEQAYELCYSCHRRESILVDQSFPYHRAHIEGNYIPLLGPPRPEPKPAPVPRPGPVTGPAPRSPGPIRRSPIGAIAIPASCHSCHDAHGSRDNPYLISFPTDVVSPTSSGLLYYRNLGPGSGECTLSCHSYEHQNARY